MCNIIPIFFSKYSAFTSHRRAISGSVQDVNGHGLLPQSPMLHQLTSPLSPPAFNPHEILLGSNEAIAGLDSPAPVQVKKNTTRGKSLLELWITTFLSH